MMKMNLRVVLLSKLAKLHPDCWTAPRLESDIPQGQLPLFEQDTKDFWFSQGHFDVLWTYKPKRQANYGAFRNMHIFNGLISNISNAECYYYPLFLLTEEDDSAFWTAKKNFLAVVRIHFAESAPPAELHCALSEKLRIKFEQSGCLFRSYYTVELSDMVLAIQSDMIQNLLEAVMKLREFPEIGRVYTYCGIHKRLLEISEQLLEMPNENGTVSDADRIPLCAMRFAVHEPQKVANALAQIRDYLGQEDAYAVVGVDDIIINWRNLPVKRMIKLYSSWYKSPQTAQNMVFSAFSSITTRMGTPWDWEIKGPTKRDRQLSDACDKIAKQIGKIRNEIHHWESNGIPMGIDQEHSWMLPLSELSIALARLSKTSVLDEFAYLMLPAAKSFLENILDLLSSPDGIEIFFQLNLENCRLFVESWAHLLECVMRVEGQLTQLPQMRPRLYDIPLILLEHLLAFAGKCAEILRGLDNGTNTREIQFLFVPRLCENIESAELFRAQIKNNRKLPGLVLVSIPVCKMYDIGELQMILCHEISHFVGEDCRLRKERIEYYAKAVGRLIEARIFQTHSAEFTEVCESWCQNLLKEFKSYNHSNVPYIKAMQQKVEECLRRKFDPWGHQSDASPLEALEAAQVAFFDWTRELLLAAYVNGAQCVPIQFDYACVRMAANELFSLLEAISSLFREIYADICMLLLLEIDPDQYAQMRIIDLNSSNGANLLEADLLEMVSYQIFISLTAIGFDVRNLEFIYSINYDDYPYSNLRKKILSIREIIFTGSFDERTSYQYCIPPECAEAILEYAKQCAAKLRTSLEKKGCRDNVAKLRGMFENSRKADMDYKELQKYILAYRESCLQIFKEDVGNI